MRDNKRQQATSYRQNQRPATRQCAALAVSSHLSRSDEQSGRLKLVLKINQSHGIGLTHFAFLKFASSRSAEGILVFSSALVFRIEIDRRDIL